MSVASTESSAARVRVGMVEIAYDVRGSGAPLLLIPGISMRRTMWPEALVDALVERGFRVVRIDNRDAGESSRIRARPPTMPRLLGRSLLGLAVDVPYRLEDMAGDAFGLMAALGHDRFHVAGASMGGMIAQTMALVEPKRLLTLTSVMSNPGGRRYSVGKLAAMRQMLAPFPRERSAQIERIVSTLRVLNGDRIPFDEEEVRAIAIGQVDAGASAAASARQLAAIVESSGRRRALLRNVTTPTLVIHGARDPLLPLRAGRATARHIPEAELLVIPEMGHYFAAPILPKVVSAIAAHASRRNA